MNEYTEQDALEAVRALREFINSLGGRGMTAMEYGPYLNELFMLEQWFTDRAGRQEVAK